MCYPGVLQQGTITEWKKIRRVEKGCRSCCEKIFREHVCNKQITSTS